MSECDASTGRERMREHTRESPCEHARSRDRKNTMVEHLGVLAANEGAAALFSPYTFSSQCRFPYTFSSQCRSQCRFCPSINLVCKVGKSTLENSSVSFRRPTFPVSFHGFMQKRPRSRSIPTFNNEGKLDL